ncbi:CBS domain-containing protein [Singulisphaera rosea]
MPTPERSRLTAADVMTPAPRTCSTFSTVLEAVLIFRDADCGAVPVLEGGKPVGVLTDRNVALAIADYDDLKDLPVGQLMSQGVVSVTPDATIGTILEKLGDKGVRRLLVVDAEERLVGIIGLADLASCTSDQAVGHTVTEVVEHT